MQKKDEGFTADTLDVNKNMVHKHKEVFPILYITLHHKLVDNNTVAYLPDGDWHNIQISFPLANQC